MSYVIVFDAERCIACGACAVACMDQNDVLPQQKQPPLRRTFITEPEVETDGRMSYFSAACEHCEDAPCISACPASCISKDPETGFTVFDNKNCIGCRSCAMACPHGAPTIGLDGKMLKCNGCNERVKAGLLPACVAVCPFDALELKKE